MVGGGGDVKTNAVGDCIRDDVQFPAREARRAGGAEVSMSSRREGEGTDAGPLPRGMPRFPPQADLQDGPRAGDPDVQCLIHTQGGDGQ